MAHVLRVNAPSAYEKRRSTGRPLKSGRRWVADGAELILASRDVDADRDDYLNHDRGKDADRSRNSGDEAR